ncbi:hypothetical protein WISP_28382 [Willisornis vidua]|uniref:Uncharacterized protein n=1 Tax=Willisornis vidua TaxID=1566151 RepID=A0ABQ9DNZ1_9PASS|nr:hypothetical protein WISP_28382 [Willisornis vidua]
MPDHSLCKEFLSNVQTKPPLAELEPVSSCSTAGCLREETNPHPATTSFQVVVESDDISPEPPLLQAKQPQVPQPFLIGLAKASQRHMLPEKALESGGFACVEGKCQRGMLKCQSAEDSFKLSLCGEGNINSSYTYHFDVNARNKCPEPGQGLQVCWRKPGEQHKGIPSSPVGLMTFQGSGGHTYIQCLVPIYIKARHNHSHQKCSFQVLEGHNYIILKLLCSRLHNPNSLSLSSQQSCFIPVIILASSLNSPAAHVLPVLASRAGGRSAGKLKRLPKNWQNRRETQVLAAQEHRGWRRRGRGRPAGSHLVDDVICLVHEEKAVGQSPIITSKIKQFQYSHLCVHDPPFIKPGIFSIAKGIEGVANLKLSILVILVYAPTAVEGFHLNSFPANIIDKLKIMSLSRQGVRTSLTVEAFLNDMEEYK